MASLRDTVRSRAGACCEFCRLPDSADEWPFHVDHVIPQQHGGSDSLDNLCWSCSRCNLLKGPNLTSIEPGNVAPIPLFQPRIDDWDAHFPREADRIVGRTSIGRVTVRLLAMNTTSRIELRRRLIENGEL